MRLAHARWFVLVGLVFSGCLLPDVDLVNSFGGGGTHGDGQSGAGNNTAGSADDRAGTSSSMAGSGATPGAGGDPVSPGSGGTPGAGGTDVSTAGGKGGGNPGSAGASGGGAGGNAGNGGSGLVSNPHAWAAWPMPNAASSSLPHPASYDLTTAGVVKDTITGLMWQRTVSTTKGTFDAAGTYCGNLTLAGFSDWRVPTRIELVSIIDYTVAPPAAAIDGTAFPSTPPDRHWTASTNWANANYAFQCQFQSGAVYTWAKDGNLGAPYVRCVRS